MHDLGNSAFNVHQVLKVLIHVHRQQIPHCQLYMTCCNIIKFTTLCMEFAELGVGANEFTHSTNSMYDVVKWYFVQFTPPYAAVP